MSKFHDPFADVFSYRHRSVVDSDSAFIYATTFGSLIGYPTDTVVMSRTIQTQATGAISVTAGTGEYQKNGGSWTAAPGTVVPGDLLRARLTTSALYETAVTVEITIDGVADVFSVTTLAEAAAIGATQIVMGEEIITIGGETVIMGAG